MGAVGLDRASTWLHQQYGHRVHDVAYLASGAWSTAYAFLLDGEALVVRFGAHVEDFQKDRAMGRFSSDALPIPRVLAIEPVDDTLYAAVSTRVYGTALDELSAADIQPVLLPLLSGLAQLQRRDLSSTAEAGIWRSPETGPTWADTLLAITGPRDRLPGWRERLNTLPNAARVFDQGVRALQRIAPGLPTYYGLIHNDLLNRNVLVDHGRVTGVFDWGNAFFGDPLYDIATFLYWWPWYPKWSEIDLSAILLQHWDAQGGEPTRMQERLRCCLLHIGLDHIAYTAFSEQYDHTNKSALQVESYL